eukprot:gene28589-31757_t
MLEFKLGICSKPPGFKLGICSKPPVGVPYALLCLANNCAIANTFTTMKDRFNKLYRRNNCAIANAFTTMKDRFNNLYRRM